MDSLALRSIGIKMDWPVLLLISLQPACGVRTDNATRYAGFAIGVMVSNNSLGHLPNTFRIWRPSSAACSTFRCLHYVRDFGNRTQSVSDNEAESFLRVARSLNLEGPRDWSTRLRD